MKIVGFRGAYRNEDVYPFPKNKDYVMMDFDDAGKE